MNVSVVSGFSLGETIKNGMSVIVIMRNDAALAKSLSVDIATRTWDDRHRHIPKLTSIEDATRMSLECGRDVSKRALLFSDDRIVEVDAPGLTTPKLSRVPYQNVLRPIFPLDADTTWSPPT